MCRSCSRRLWQTFRVGTEFVSSPGPFAAGNALIVALVVIVILLGVVVIYAIVH